ncbi:MAG: hypothetical protein IH945_07400 [Armatimonadetes bacterium]|nr:hypothetical protein [Armatimonadota bacterium]
MPDYIEWYLVEFEAALRKKKLTDSRRENLMSELRDHLESSKRELVRSGLDDERAAKSAVNALGAPRELAASLSRGAQRQSWRNTLRWSLLPGVFLIPFAYLLLTQSLGAADFNSDWIWFGQEVATVYFCLAGLAFLVALIKSKGWVAFPLCVGILLIGAANSVRILKVGDLFVWTNSLGDERQDLARTDLLEEELTIKQRGVQGMTYVVEDIERWQAVFAPGAVVPASPNTSEMRILVDGKKWVAPKYNASLASYEWADSRSLGPDIRNEGTWFKGYSSYSEAQIQWARFGASHLTGARFALVEHELKLKAFSGTGATTSQALAFLTKGHWDLFQYIFSVLLSVNLLFLIGLFSVRSMKRRFNRPVIA